MTHNAAAEQAVIGGLLITPDAFDLITDIVSPAAFWNAGNRRIYTSLSGMLSRGESVDVVTLAEELERSGDLSDVGGLGYLVEIQQNTPSAANIRRHAQIIADLSTERALLDASAKIASIVEEGGTTAEKLDQSQALISGIAEAKHMDEPTPMKEALLETITRIQERAESGLEFYGATTGLVDLDKATGGISDGALMVIAGRPSMGKAQPLTSKVLLADGTWKFMGDIRVDDDLASTDGIPSRVIGVFPQGEKEIFEVEFSDGRKTRACSDHLWRVMYRDWVEPRVVNTDKLRSMLGCSRYTNRLYIEMVSGDFGSGNLPIDPYVLGVLLGDGYLKGLTPRFTSADPELLTEVQSILGGEVELRKTGIYDYNIVSRGVPGRLVENGCKLPYPRRYPDVYGDNEHRNYRPRTVYKLRDSLSDLGLHGKGSEEKFIPDIYLSASRDDRLSLLQGLMDTDGWAELHGSVRFSSCSRALSDGVETLVRSLGGVCSITKKKPFSVKNGVRKPGLDAWVCRIRHENAETFFRLQRKSSRAIRQKKTTVRLNVKSIEQVGVEPSQCIAVTHPSHLYVTDDYIVTHNTSIAMQIAEHAGEKGAVLIFSLEMPTHELTSRMLASRARIPLDRLMSGNLNDEQWTALTAATARLRENKVLIVDAAILTITSMRSQCRRVKRKHGLSMIVLDYIQLMTHNKANDVDGLTDISRGLKLIAKELNVPVIALSQLNRSCDSRPDKRPLMPDLRSSGSIEQDADIILMVYRDEVYNPDSDRKGIAELLIRKNRNGGLKDVLTTFIPEFTRFENFFGQIEQQQQSYTPKRRTVKDF